VIMTGVARTIVVHWVKCGAKVRVAAVASSAATPIDAVATGAPISSRMHLTAVVAQTDAILLAGRSAVMVGAYA